MKREIVGQSKLGDELLVCVGSTAAQAMIEVRDGKHQAKLLADFQEQAEHRHGIGTTGNGKSNAIAWAQRGRSGRLSEETLRKRGEHLRRMVRRDVAKKQGGARDAALNGAPCGEDEPQNHARRRERTMYEPPELRAGDIVDRQVKVRMVEQTVE